MDRTGKIIAAAVFLVSLALTLTSMGRTGITSRELALCRPGFLPGAERTYPGNGSAVAGGFYRVLEPAGRLVTARPYSLRVGAALFFSLTVLVVFIWTAQTLGPAGGLVAALLLLTLPRAFAAGIQATEFPVLALAGTLSAWLVDRYAGATGTVLLGLVMGLGLAVSPKFLLIAFCVLVWLTLSGRLKDRARCLASGLIGMLLVPVLVNPSWWAGPLESYRNWLAEGLTFTGYTGPVLYFGKAFHESVPWHYVIVMLVVGMPLTVVALAVSGKLVSAIPRYFRGPAGFAVVTSTCFILYATSGRFPADCGLAFFLPLFAADSIMSAFSLEWFRLRLAARGFRLPAWLLIPVVILPQAVVGSRLYPFLGCHYNPITGFLSGAERAGFQITFDSSPLTDNFLSRVEKALPGQAAVGAAEFDREAIAAGGRLAGRVSRVSGQRYVILLNSPASLAADSAGLFRKVSPLTVLERGGVILAGLYEVPH